MRTLLILLFVIPIIVMGIGFLAATLGFFEAWRVRRRDNREFGRRNDSA